MQHVRPTAGMFDIQRSLLWDCQRQINTSQKAVEWM
jgi:hypothetical protein